MDTLLWHWWYCYLFTNYYQYSCDMSSINSEAFTSEWLFGSTCISLSIAASSPRCIEEV